jgi:hypothetical protein
VWFIFALDSSRGRCLWVVIMPEDKSDFKPEPKVCPPESDLGARDHRGDLASPIGVKGVGILI